MEAYVYVTSIKTEWEVLSTRLFYSAVLSLYVTFNADPVLSVSNK